MKIMICKTEYDMIQINKSKIMLDDSRKISCKIKFDMTKAMSAIDDHEETVQLPSNFGDITAYLRFVNAEGHPWTSTAVIRVQCHTFTGNKYYSQYVFRIPQWQPSWLINVTEIIKGWVKQQTEVLCIELTGSTNENGPIYLYNEQKVLGLQPLLILSSCHGKNCDDKINTALWSLKHIYIHRDLSWSGCFVRTAQANLHRLTGDIGYLNALKSFFDSNLDQHGNFSNVSEEYFYAAANGPALLYLYDITKDLRYAEALVNLKNGILSLNKSKDGIIMAGNRVEAELIFCVCVFLAKYAAQFNDDECSRACVEQTADIFELLSEGQNDGIPLQNIERPFSKGWSRGIGWIVAGLGKILNCPAVRKQSAYSTLFIYFNNICYNIIKYQGKKGLFRSIIYDANKPYEVTGSGLIALGFELGVQIGALPEIYHKSALKTLSHIPEYSKTGMDMIGCFPMNFFERYEIADFSGNSDQGFGVWMELYSTVMLNMTRRTSDEEHKNI